MYDQVPLQLKLFSSLAAIACLLCVQLINEKPQVIQDYESGKAIPNPQVLSKLSRVLGVTLRKNAK
jgi:transcriptional regulator with XRE-family HTH domain